MMTTGFPVIFRSVHSVARFVMTGGPTRRRGSSDTPRPLGLPQGQLFYPTPTDRPNGCIELVRRRIFFSFSFELIHIHYHRFGVTRVKTTGCLCLPSLSPDVLIDAATRRGGAGAYRNSGRRARDVHVCGRDRPSSHV